MPTLDQSKRLTVMISSTVRDLPEHRKEAIDACLRQGMFPIVMEHLSARDEDAIAASLSMVNQADIYLGIFADRYGYIPPGHTISITEMEYHQAVKRGIPRLFFLMHHDHLTNTVDGECGEKARKLQLFKTRVATERIVNYFSSPVDLRAHIINSLSHYRNKNLTELHYVSDIPTPPECYIAHPYTLLQTSTLIGRQTELSLLTDWITNQASALYHTGILTIVALGGMGKSAMTWKWFQEIAPVEMKHLAGRMWWSFYESNASFPQFILCALAYVSGKSKEEFKHLSSPELEKLLLDILNREPFLIVLDGLERLLIAYARIDASRLIDNELDQQTANGVAGAHSLPESAAQSFLGQHPLRKTVDPYIGTFLRKLAMVRASRVLVSTRLFPADLQTETGGERPGTKAIFLHGLIDDDALNLWRAFGVSGDSKTLLPLFHTFGNHPLLIQILAGMVANDRHTPGKFDLWYQNHPDFNPFRLPLIQAQSHVLAIALRGLDEVTQRVLFNIAAFRMPSTYDTLVALFVGEQRLFEREDGIVQTLTDLEDRGLLGWDRRANRYDLHPIVRGVTWAGLNITTKQDIYETLHSHFSSLPSPKKDVKSIEDLTGSIELYNSLIGLRRFDDAFVLFNQRLFDPLISLGAVYNAKELLEALFPLRHNGIPQLDSILDQSSALAMLAICAVDQPKQAIEWYRLSIKIGLTENIDNMLHLELIQSLLAEQLCFSGMLYQAELSISQALKQARDISDITDESYALDVLGLILAARGKYKEGEQASRQALKLMDTKMSRRKYLAYDSYALSSLWSEHYARAYSLAKVAKNYYQNPSFDLRKPRALWLCGKAALKLGKLSDATKYLHEALTQARELSLIIEELPARVCLAELQRQQGNLKIAHEFLNDVLEIAERGSFRLCHADAYNVLTQIALDEGNTKAAIHAAYRAYHLAWCDGFPYVYYQALQRAEKYLLDLNAPIPVLPPFNLPT
jgi:tetratricopeptide (TPR) repeat protein